MLATLIVLSAKYLVAVPVLVALGFFVFGAGAKRRRLLIYALFALPLSYLLGLFAGLLYYNPRPFVVDGTTPLLAHAANNGFPSDHTLLAATLAMLIWYYNRALGAILFVLAFLIGFARVASGIHHWLDILASFVISIVAVWLVHIAYRAYSRP